MITIIISRTTRAQAHDEYGYDYECQYDEYDCAYDCAYAADDDYADDYHYYCLYYYLPPHALL